MSDDKPGKDFWNRADDIIHLANEQCQKIDSGQVSSSLLYATARFNAFIVASNSEGANGMKKDKEEAIKYFTNQYKKMLLENLDDYIKNYDKYIKEP